MASLAIDKQNSNKINFAVARERKKGGENMEARVFIDEEEETEETPEGCCDVCGMPFEECPAEKEEVVESVSLPLKND